jgi:MFS family permease
MGSHGRGNGDAISVAGIDPGPGGAALSHDASSSGEAAGVRTIVIVGASVFLGFLALGAVLPIVPLYGRGALGLGDSAIGVVMGVQALVAVIGRPLAGRAGPRFGWKLVLQAGLLLVTIGCGCYLLPFGLAGLTLARVVCGAGEAMVLTGGGAWLVARAPETRRGRVLGLFGMAMWCGMGIGPVLGDIASRRLGTTSVWIFAVIAACCGTCVISASRDDGAEPSHGPPRHGLIPPTVIVPGLIMTFATMGYSAVATFLSLHLQARGLTSGPEVFGVFAIAFVTSRALIGGIVDRAGAVRTAAVASVGSATGLILLGIAHTTTWAVMGSAFTGGCFSLIYPSLAVLAIRGVPPSDRGTAIGAFTTSYDLGLLLGSPLLGVIASRAGYPAAFVAAAIASLTATTIVVAYGRRARKAAKLAE